jgi:hypothetical protein
LKTLKLVAAGVLPMMLAVPLAGHAAPGKGACGAWPKRAPSP